MVRIVTLMSSLLLSAAVLIACGGTDESAPSSAPASPNGQSSSTEPPPPSAPNSPGPPQAASGEIVISNMTFTVPPSVRPGQQLTIVNKDDSNHTVTADNNQFDIRISGGGGMQSFAAPTTPGTYPFHCKYHADMHGLLTVQ
jgi:plastocyanin